jgi:hypothetical protein
LFLPKNTVFLPPSSTPDRYAPTQQVLDSYASTSRLPPQRLHAAGRRPLRAAIAGPAVPPPQRAVPAQQSSTPTFSLLTPPYLTGSKKSFCFSRREKACKKAGKCTTKARERRDGGLSPVTACSGCSPGRGRGSGRAC